MYQIKTIKKQSSQETSNMASCQRRLLPVSYESPLGGIFSKKGTRMDTYQNIQKYRDDIDKLERSQNARALREVNKSFYKEKHSPNKSFGWIAAFMVSALFWAIVLIAGCTLAKPAHAQDIDDGDAIKAIIGEAENQGYKGMLAVACAIRNRGTLKGVYGIRAPRVKNYLYSRATHRMAFLAWHESEKHDITNGATHWENIKAFGCPSWVKGCIEVFRYKDHVFYREVRA